MNSGVLCQSLVKNFGDPPTEVLRNISFTVERGEFVAITGRSGSGKSTLLYVTSGLDDPTAGEVYIAGKNVHRMDSASLHDFRNGHIGFVFQFHYLLPELTAIENILMPARKFRNEKEKKSKALRFLHDFELDHCINKFPMQMSGGEQQRVAIARALIMDPDFLFADEPTGNLDSINGERVLRIFEEINRNHGTTILLVTHEMDFAARAGRQIHLVDGMITSDTRKEKGRKKR
ncbi:MAG: ABC transporter ATP-binding protein [Spirochaetes bacterium]|nr:MAG: ABC transporter ATP-binding protein [Spirochaetota bacterium]